MSPDRDPTAPEEPPDHTRAAHRSEPSIIDLLAMPGAEDIPFDPPPMAGPLFRPAEFD